MSKDRLTQLVAVAVALIALVGSSLLINPISRQRRDLQLTFAVDANQGEPPQYALLAAGLGSFRGVAVNALWYRAEMMKREGQFAEANTLATWITYLQPRFPHVWGFLAWNMAYNISVETFTPQERYDWVNKGIELLRQQGIPYNPNAVRLYRELAWILFHKVGQFTDDVNWYYKGEFARQWEELLGAAPEQADAAGVIAEFGATAEFADRYFAVDRPSYAVRRALDALASSNLVPAVTERHDALSNLGIVPLHERLTALRREVPASNERGILLFDQLMDTAKGQLSRAERDATTVFAEDHPRAAAIIGDLRGLGLSLDETALRAIGQCLMYLRFRGPEVVATLPPQVMSDEAKRVLPLVLRSLTAEPGSDARAGFRELLLFLRAKVLIEAYNMQPTVMHRYMLTYGPFDWRHPHSHSFYWGRLGVEQYYDLRDDTKVDLINTMRLALHSVQSLSDYGTVSFNPLNRPGQQIDLLPDPDFIEGYFTIVNETQAMADDKQLGRQIRADAFAAGEENFLQKAVLYAFLYGSESQAERYYRRLINEFGQEPHNVNRSNWYDLPLGDFVAMLIFDDDLGRPGMISLINSRLLEAFRSGLATSRFQVFDRNIQIAQAVHAMYQEQYGYETGLAVGGGRMRLPEFVQMVEDAFTQFMQSRQIDLFVRLNAYHTAYQAAAAGMPLAPATYWRWARSTREEVAAQGLDPDLALPVPANAADEAGEGLGERQGGSTIQRQ